MKARNAMVAILAAASWASISAFTKSDCRQFPEIQIKGLSIHVSARCNKLLNDGYKILLGNIQRLHALDLIESSIIEGLREAGRGPGGTAGK